MNANFCASLKLLWETRFVEVTQITLICDNQDALHIASNPIFHERTRCSEIIRENILSADTPPLSLLAQMIHWQIFSLTL